MYFLYDNKQYCKPLIIFISECADLEKYIINGGKVLSGEVTISGAKNAAVAIIPATILCDEPCRIENIPNISDVTLIAKILQNLGAKVTRVNKSTLDIDPRPINTYSAVDDSVRGMRASYYLLGALIGRFNNAKVALPGGCNFGLRPIDQHLRGFAAMGAQCDLINGAIVDAHSQGRIQGASIYLDTVSVGTTINLMLAAVKAQGMTIIENAAKEPHIVDLANFLNSMGANIRGAGTDVIKIRGVDYLHGITYSIIPDQIEAGTYMAAVAATRGKLLVKNVTPKHLESITAKLKEIGVYVEEFDEAVLIDATDRKLRRCNLKTMPHPGFPTDCQPQFVAMLATCEGTSIVTENVWDNRYQYIRELLLMGAHISVEGRVAIVDGMMPLHGAPVKATDLRAGAALIIAGLVASGVTEISSIHYIERGYEEIIEKLRALGADIRKQYVPGEDASATA